MTAATQPPSPPGAGPYAEIAVDAPVGPDRTFTYAVPPSMQLAPGQAVWVPFGPRPVAGVVFAVTDRNSSPVVELRDVAGVQDASPALQRHQLDLAWWLSHETRSSLYEAAALMLPFDYRRRLRSALRLAPVGEGREAPEVPDRYRWLLDRVARGDLDEERLRQSLGGATPSAVRALLRTGHIGREWRWQRPRAGPVYAARLHLRVTPEEAGERLTALPPRQRALVEHLLVERETDATQARKEFGTSAVAGVVVKGLGAISQSRRTRDPLAGSAFPREAPPTLTAAQAKAIGAVIEAFDTPGTDRVFLLHGPTGSGKTEVYLRAFAHCIERGKRGMLLAPEISLTSQLIARLEGRFPGRVGVLHSGLSPGQQYDAWWRLREGAFDVLVGSRGAVFAPQPDLGVIVLDEEHEWTYKQSDTSPRYHARDVAVKLSELTGAVVVLGSATPDVASSYEAEQGGFRLLSLPSRVRPVPGARPAAIPLARAQIVDMREELKAGVRSIFSRALREGLEETVRGGHQAILLVNRRGAAGTVQCRDCGHVLRCSSCDTSLTYHSEGDRLLCHRCGRATRGTRRCPRCRSARIRHLGLGTQRVVQEVEQLCGGPVLRWDRDAARERDAHRTIMDRFMRGDAQVLVGTQMVAQGLHLPRVTLVGVVLADLGLSLPDFRAGERTFQLLCQVAGRAGRGVEPGRVIVQTYSPEHYAVRAGAHQDYGAFYEREIAYRREHRNPPFSRLARLVYQHRDPVRCQEEAERLADDLRGRSRAQGLVEVDVMGPAPAFPARVQGYHRWQLVVRVLPSSAVELPSMLADVTLPPGWLVDVDPVTLV